MSRRITKFLLSNSLSRMFVVSVAIHAGVIWFCDGMLIEQPSYAMSAPQGISLELIAGPPPGQSAGSAQAAPAPEPQPVAEPPLPVPELKRLPEPKRELVKKHEMVKPKIREKDRAKLPENTVAETAAPTPEAPLQTASLASSDLASSGSQTPQGVSGGSGQGGGVPDSPAMPDYLRNPPPVYPRESRKASEEGVVLLSVSIDRDGEVQSLSLKKTSAFPRLDAAALEAVKKWKFKPARLGGMPLASTVDVPVRFVLR